MKLPNLKNRLLKRKNSQPISRQQKRKNRDPFSAGFSFLEVLIGCILFTVGTVGIYNVYIAGERSRYFASQHVRAVYLANGIINELESKDFDRIEPRQDISMQDFPGYSCSVSLSPVPAFPGTKAARQVSVEVSYDVQGKKKNILLTSLFFRDAANEK